MEEGIFYKVQLFFRNGGFLEGESGRKGAAAAGKKGQERRRQENDRFSVLFVASVRKRGA